MPEIIRPGNGQTNRLGERPVEPDGGADHGRAADQDRYATTALWPEALALTSGLLLVSLLLTGWVRPDHCPV